MSFVHVLIVFTILCFPSERIHASANNHQEPTEMWPTQEIPAFLAKPGERFVSRNNSVVTSQIGAVAALHCQTSMNSGGQVSWIRVRDYQLLTVGLKVHSSDDRFSVKYGTWDWQLEVKYVQPRDEGTYECQITSHPPTSIFVHLKVVEARAEILGAPEKHVKLGSILRLVCVVHHTTEPPKFFFWYQGKTAIHYDDLGLGVVVESDDHTSVLLVTRADEHHSGNYTCLPSNSKPASIIVHILSGDYPAAMRGVGRGSLVLSAPRDSPMILLTRSPLKLLYTTHRIIIILAALCAFLIATASLGCIHSILKNIMKILEIIDITCFSSFFYSFLSFLFVVISMTVYSFMLIYLRDNYLPP